MTGSLSVARFRSGEVRIVLDPDAENLVYQWRAALTGAGDQVGVLRVSRMDLNGHPERIEYVDLTAIESIEGT